jgi:NAD(P)-dependent dehydrogenase (short-subunit alcohol dehydrogenase family)
MLFYMSEKIAVVTGASKGIGRACGLGLANLGYHVVLAARSVDKLETLRNEILQQMNAGATVQALDVIDDSSIQAFTSMLTEKFGQVDVFVNNAGIDAQGTLGLDMETFDNLMATNLRAPFMMLKYLAPLMEKSPEPYIFNIASRAGKVGFAHNGGYVATKFALVGLNESLYKEFATSKIRVTAICPGWVYTDMAQGSGLEPHEMIQVEDIVKTLGWLLSLSPQTCVKEVVIEMKKSIA